MTEVKNFQCPNCGSPLAYDGQGAETKCPYCGSMVIVPEELRPHKDSASLSSTPYSMPVYSIPSIPQYSDQVSKQVSTVGKVAAGIALSTMIAPILITGVVICIVSVFLIALFWGINSTFQASNPHALQTALVATLIPEIPIEPTTAPTEAISTEVPTAIPLSTPFAKVLFHDNFSSKKSGWDTLSDSDYTLAFVKGGYRIFINAQDGGQASWLDNLSFGDVNVAVDVKYVAGPDDGRFGVTCRVKKAGFYSFEFSPDGSYSIEKYTSGSDGSTSEVLADGSIDLTQFSSSAIFHLRGDCVGDTLTLYLNGDPLLQASDSAYKSGGIGLIARTGPSGEAGVDTLFSNYSVTGK